LKGYCRCCTKEYNKIKNARSECKNWYVIHISLLI
jgi:hypothetical protein